MFYAYLRIFNPYTHDFKYTLFIHIQRPNTHGWWEMFDFCMTRMALPPTMWGNRPVEYHISLGLSVVWCRSTGPEIVPWNTWDGRGICAKISSCRVCPQGLSTETWVYFPFKSVSFPLPYTYVPILYTTVHILLQRGNGLLHKLHDA